MAKMVNDEVKELSEALRERDERFDELFKLSSDWYWKPARELPLHAKHWRHGEK